MCTNQKSILPAPIPWNLKKNFLVWQVKSFMQLLYFKPVFCLWCKMVVLRFVSSKKSTLFKSIVKTLLLDKSTGSKLIQDGDMYSLLRLFIVDIYFMVKISDWIPGIWPINIGTHANIWQTEDESSMSCIYFVHVMK